MSEQVIHVACAVAGDYDAHSAALLHSAAVHSGSMRLEVHYLHGPEFSSDSISRIRSMLDNLGAGSSFLEIRPDRVEGLPVLPQFTVAMWYRIFLPDLVSADRILYMDADAIVADSLEPLWRSDLRGAAIGAVRNVFQDNHAHRPEALGLGDAGAYFNSGVLLVDLRELRAMNATESLRGVAKLRGESLDWPDQDVLNIVFHGRWMPLHPRWNVMNSMRLHEAASVFDERQLLEARQRPGIRHFEGPGANKPWHFFCDRDDRELYVAHRSETPWPTYALEGAPSSLRRGVRAMRSRFGS